MLIGDASRQPAVFHRFLRRRNGEEATDERIVSLMAMLLLACACKCMCVCCERRSSANQNLADCSLHR